MLAIFIVGMLCSISGFMLYNTEYQPLINFGLGEDFAEETHEILANLFLILVGLHLLGLIVDFIVHGRVHTIKSMFTGYKNIEGRECTSKHFS